MQHVAASAAFVHVLAAQLVVDAWSMRPLAPLSAQRFAISVPETLLHLASTVGAGAAARDQNSAQK